MVSLKVEVRKKDVTWVVLLVAVLVVGVVYAYGTSNPAVMGHSADEIEVTNAFCNKITGHNCGSDNYEANTDDQTLSVSGQTLSISSGNSVSLPGGLSIVKYSGRGCNDCPCGAGAINNGGRSCKTSCSGHVCIPITTAKCVHYWEPSSWSMECIQ